MRRIGLCSVVFCMLLLATAAMAQDPAQADPGRYKVVFENDQVRVLHIKVGPHEKGVMHEHPASVVIWVSDAKGTLTTAEGVEEFEAKAGDVSWAEATKHQGENTSDQPLEVYQIELKGDEKWTQISGTIVCDPAHQEHAVPVEGRPHHSYVVNQTKCTWTKPWMIRGLASAAGVGTGTVEDHGMVSFSSGTYVDTMENGDKAYYDYSFKTATKEGMATISGHKWKLLGGTGEIKGAKGKGTCDATSQEDGTVLYHCQGKYK